MGESTDLYISTLATLAGFMLLLAMIRHYAPATPLPAESWLLMAGMGYGLLSPQTDLLPAVRLAPELVISLILPMLVFAAGRRLPVALLFHSAGPVALLVLVGTPLRVILIGLPAAWLLDLPLAHGLLFGAAVAATDPTAAGQVLQRFNIPERLKLMLHGESIFNDSITIVLFTTLAAVIMAQGDFVLGNLGITLVRSMLLAVPVGLLMGWLAGLLVKAWHEQNQMPGLTITLAVPMITFLISDRLLHASGVIAVLCAALAFSYTRLDRDLGDRQLYDELWDYLGSLLASLLFFALGAAIAGHGFRLNGLHAGLPLLLLLSRAVLAYGSGPLLRIRGRPLARDWRHIVLLGGLTGAVPAALVLMTPLDFAYRDLILTMVFTLVTYSIIVHPLLLRWYLQRQPLSHLAGERETDVSSMGLGQRRGLTPTLERYLQASSWHLAAIAGVIAGSLFLLVEMALVLWVQNLSPWLPVRMIAAIGLGPEALPPPTAFAGDVVLVALVVHFTLSLVYGWLLAPLIEGRTLLPGTLLGLVFSLGLYLVNFYLFTALFPWFADARGGVTVFTHLLFGGALAGSYLLLQRRTENKEPAQNQAH